ncbi:Fc receptor-like protein 5 [Lacerta agilis]|uniref:Fc receptor-like protein 5 n=1 Tax=Lacerta agilis TaxID=80427 RepID=UPI00141968D4|nr:Fc receptor-like protein 5 [Lacerta agilis]
MEFAALVTVSFSVLSWMVPIGGFQTVPPPPAPRLTTSPPPNATFVRGEKVQFKCHRPEGHKGEWFYFFKATRRGQWSKYRIINRSILEVSTMHLEPRESFVCSYWRKNREGRESAKSNQVVLSVAGKKLSSSSSSGSHTWRKLGVWHPRCHDFPLPATLSLNPLNPVYTHGEQITLHCSVPDGREAAGYTFYKELQGQTSEELPRKELAIPHKALRVGEDTAGNYSCAYSIRLEEKEIRSPRSNIISVIMEVKCWGKSNLEEQEEGGPGDLGTLEPQTTLSQGSGTTYAVIPFCSAATSSGPVMENELQQVEEEGLLYTSLLTHLWGPACAGYPPPPRFSVSPRQDIYRTGELINLTCSAPDHYNMSGVTFSSQQWTLYFQTHLPSGGAFTHALRLSPQDSGKYSCDYIVMQSRLRSQSSDSIHIAVMDPLPPPVLKTDPPYRVVNEGDPLLLTCSAKGGGVEKRFHFYRDGVEMTSDSDGSLRFSGEHGGASPGVSVNIPQAKLNHTGEFACRYEEKMSRGWIVSPWSQKVYLTVWAPNSSSPPLLYACLAIPLAILMVPLAFYCTRRKRALKSEQENNEEANSEYLEMFSATRKPQRTQTPFTALPPPALPQPPISPSRMENGAKLADDQEEGLYNNIPLQAKKRAEILKKNEPSGR